MVSLKYDLSKFKIKNNDTFLNMLKKQSIFYIKRLYKTRFIYKDRLNILNQIQDYINKEYNITCNIKNLIINILLHLNIDINNKLYIQSFFSENIPSEKLFNTITYGALNCPRSTVINNAIIFALNTMDIMRLI